MQRSQREHIFVLFFTFIRLVTFFLVSSCFCCWWYCCVNFTFMFNVTTCFTQTGNFDPLGCCRCWQFDTNGIGPQNCKQDKSWRTFCGLCSHTNVAWRSPNRSLCARNSLLSGKLLSCKTIIAGIRKSQFWDLSRNGNPNLRFIDIWKSHSALQLQSLPYEPTYHLSACWHITWYLRCFLFLITTIILYLCSLPFV